MPGRSPTRSIAIAVLLASAASLTSCGDDDAVADSGSDGGAADAATDAGPVPIEFTATADPAERSDCTERPPAGVARAKHITCDAELVPGALAMGRIGDVVIDNAVARFVIRTGEEGASTIGAYGGGIVDAAHPGGVDQIKEIFPLVSFAVARATDVVVTDAGEDGDARVTVLFEADTLRLLDAAAPGLSHPIAVRGAAEYTLAADAPALSIRVRYSATPGFDDVRFTPGIVALIGGNAELSRPLVGLIDAGSTTGPSPVLVGEGRTEAFALALDADPGTLLSVLTIHLIQAEERVVASAGVESSFEGRLAVGPTAADVWRAVAPPLPSLEVSGPPGDRVDVAHAEGGLIFRTRLGEDGAASIPLPEAEYRLTSGFDAFFHGAEVAATVGASGGSATVVAAPSATLGVDALADGEASPVRVMLRDETTLEERLRFAAIGATSRRVPPGTYRMTVSRGMEHDAHEETLALAADETRMIAPVLDRAVDTDGWVAVDLHLHTDFSTDSRRHVEEALAIFAAEGLEVVASTDHDYITDYAPIAARVGVADWLTVVPGVEVSSTVLGHFGGYPLVPDPDASGAGAPVWFGRSPGEIFDAIRARGDETLGGALVQINHPRFGGAAYFTVIGLDPDTGHATSDPVDLGLPPETDLDDLAFDVVEVWNGISRGDNEESFLDFLALAAAGRRFAMVGNSDTHDLETPAGVPRSYVRVPDDARGSYGWTEVAAGLRAGDATVSAGIFVTAELDAPRAGGIAPVHVRVQAPPWVEVDRLRVYVGREMVHERVITTTDPLRLDEVIDVPMDAPGFVVVRADGMREALLLDLAPYGVTNPLDVP